jgi:hypothetical protein
VSAKLDEMWAALEAHKPKRGYAKAWRVMCSERTRDAAEAKWAEARALAAEAAARAAEAAARAAEADDYAQRAIDALKREAKP